MADDPILREAIERLIREFAPRRIILFGSRAWGEPAEDSDYDLVVLVDATDDTRALAGRMRWALRGVPASFDVIARTTAAWDTASARSFSLEERIQREGKDLLAAA